MRVHVAGTCSSCDILVFTNSTGLNSCAIKQGQNDLSFECFNMCTVFANCFGYDIKMNQSGVSASYENVNEYEDSMSNQNPNLLQGVKDVPSQYKIHTRSLNYLTP